MQERHKEDDAKDSEYGRIDFRGNGGRTDKIL
jgi:hypothetical protein